ncbi:hypothetical protein HDU84_006117 [Entophlyctis sp. JEL0112]|nr:hypothetical protein HDU84_006117 [Entophlyctis sp. JEL0112]
MFLPTARQQLVLDHVRKAIAAGPDTIPFREFCEYSFKTVCAQHRADCTKVHVVIIEMPYTSRALGDCSYLNTCHRIHDGCKYVHYQIDPSGEEFVSLGYLFGTLNTQNTENLDHNLEYKHPVPKLADVLPPQWYECDVRKVNLKEFGTDFSVIMALCLELWGYKRVDEIVWIKTNQLQRMIRTGRTGHWLNHGKEHCIVALKGNPPENYNPGVTKPSLCLHYQHQ